MNTPLWRPIRSGTGFTIAELMVALGLVSVVLTILVTFFMNLSRASTTQNAIAGAQQSVRAGLDFIIQDVRMAGLDPFQTAGAGIEEISAGGNKLRFTSDRCNLGVHTAGCAKPVPDGDLDDDSERVTYVFDAKARVLKRCLYETSGTYGLDGSGGSCQSILKNVMPNPDGTPLFAFIDDAGNAITDNADRSLIRTIVLTLTVEEPAGIQKKVSRTYASRLRLRNIGL